MDQGRSILLHVDCYDEVFCAPREGLGCIQAYLLFASVFGYDLQTESGRQRYLEERCHLFITLTNTREEARDMERPKEKRGDYRFGGRVKALPLN